MPDPRTLKVGDLILFVALPDEWSQPNYTIQRSDIAFMKKMILRTWPSRVIEIDEYGGPWIRAIVLERGRRKLHSWKIMESTGWRLVKHRRIKEN